MKRFIVIAVAVILTAATAGCSKPTKVTAAPATSDAGVAAIVNGTPITMKDLDDASKNQLAKVDTEIYQIKKRTLDGLVESKLIEEAAKKKGVSTEKFMDEEVNSKVKEPTEDEIKALYDARKGAINKTYEEVKGQIAQYLKQNRMAQAKGDLMARLRQEGKVEIKLEPPRVEIDTKGAASVGDDNAKVTIVEFSDYQCPFCKRVRPTIWRLVDEYKGKVRYVFMDFPLSFHNNAKKAAEAAHCAGDQGKYFEFNRKIFDNQEKISVDDLKGYAKQLQLDTKKFDKCLDSGEHTKDVEESIKKGSSVGVSGTPAYFINGIMLSGAMPYESFKEIIDSELNR